SNGGLANGSEERMTSMSSAPARMASPRGVTVRRPPSVHRSLPIEAGVSSTGKADEAMIHSARSGVCSFATKVSPVPNETETTRSLRPDARTAAASRPDRIHWCSGRESYTDVLKSEEHTSELQSPYDLVCRLLLEKKN